MMLIRKLDKQHFSQKARQVRDRVPIVLEQWGLPAKFTRWRLTQDPTTGLVVLFGVLNNQYITAHTALPLSDYFDPRLLLDLAIELKVQVVSSHREGFRYAFILDRGQLGQLPTRVDLPNLEQSQLLIGVTYAKEPITVVWGEPIVIESATEVAQRNLLRQMDRQVLADLRLALIKAQTKASLLVKPPPPLRLSNTNWSSLLDEPTVIVQVEAEAEQRKALYQQWSDNSRNLTEPGADDLEPTNSEPMVRMLLMLDEYNDLVRALGETEGEFDETTRLAKVGRA